MFEQVFASVSDEALVELIEQSTRDEARISARRSAAIAELVHRNVDEDDERGGWVFDPWANTAAQIAAAMNIGQRKASGQMRIAVALRYRLPKVAELFSRGALSARVVSEITWRTHLVEDLEALALIDDHIAKAVLRWGPLSERKLKSAIDAVIDRFDPEGLRRSREFLKARDIQIGASDDPNETAAIWGRLLATDGEVLERRLRELVNVLCDEDPRSMGERRSDAVGAIARGDSVLACRCGSPACEAPNEAPKSNVVIKIIADQAAIDAAQAVIDEDNAEATEVPTETAPPKPVNRGSALRLDGRPVPTVLLAEAIRGGAKVSELVPPGSEPEPRYRPSAALAEFVRMRDLFCRFPGCDIPAERCDIDHVAPWPFGPTHASNLNCKCRGHHLMKTFWCGPGGWNDVQLPDGTVIWTAPTGHRYVTRPGSRLYFPAADVSTVNLPPPPKPPPGYSARDLMMPRRRRPRAAEEAARIKSERDHNAVQRALEREQIRMIVGKSRKSEHRREFGNDPPPF